MDAGADGDDFVGVHALVGLFADEFAGRIDDLRHTGHAADEDEFIDFVFRPLRVVQAILHGLECTLEEIVGELLELRAGEFLLDVFRTRGVCGHERKIDLVFLGRGESDLRFFGLFLDALNGVGLLREVDAGLAFELRNDPIHDAVIPVITTEVGVAIGGAYLEDTVADFQRRDVECAAAEVIHSDLLVFFLIESVGQRGGGRFVDDALDVEAGDLACIFRRVTL